MRKYPSTYPLSLAVAAAVALPLDARSAILEEVIVTARKKEESFLDVPVSSVTIDQVMLENYQITDFYNLADRVAGLVIGNNVGSVGANASIRGIGSSAFNPSTDGAVSVNVDGMQFSHGDVLRTGFFDVQQIEVLKGPQALFFGKNSPAGIISIRTQDPGDENEFMARVGYESEAEKILVEGVMSGPLGDSLKGRLAISYQDQEGYFDNPAQPADGLGGVAPRYDSFPNGDSIFARGTLLAEPTDWLDVRFKLNYEDRDIQGDGGTGQIVGCDLPFDPIEKCRLDDEATIADLDPEFFTQTPNGGVPFQESTFWFSTLELNFALGDDLNLTSITGYSSSEHDFNINGTMQPGTLDQLTPFLGIPGSVPVEAPNGHEQTYLTQEFRFASDYSGSLNWVAGLFYEDGEQEFYHGSKVPDFGVDNDHVQNIDIETWSVFGQLIWDITEHLELAVGARYIDEERDLATVDNGIILGAPVGPGVVDLEVDNISNDETLPEVTLNWNIQDNFSMFAAYRTGWKSGSFNVDQPSANDRSYDPEDAQGFEVGFKGITLDNTLRFSAAVYYYEYDDLQMSKTVSAPGGAGTLLKIVNAASAESQGVEFDFTWAPQALEGLQVHGAINYNKAEFDEFDDAACYGGQTIDLGCSLTPLAVPQQDLSGRPLPRAPEWTANLGFDFDRQITDNGLMLGFSMAAAYTDDMWMDASFNPRTFQDSYTKTNASLRLYPGDRSWEVALIGNNITDEVTASTCFSGPFDHAGGLVPNPSGLPINPIIPGGTDQALCFAEPGREIWLRATYFWGR